MGRRLLATTTAWRRSISFARHHRYNDRAFLYAFDLIELNGDDLRRDPLEVRKATLRSMLAKAGLGLRFNEHLEGDGPTVFAHACKLGLEGNCLEAQGFPYRSGCSPEWLKMKNANAAPMTEIPPILFRAPASPRAILVNDFGILQ